MNREEFLGAVQELAGVRSHEDAESAVVATLQTLGERLNGDEAGQLASFLPAELTRGMVSEQREADAFGLEEFLGRVSERADIDTAAAERRARAVLEVTWRSVPAREMHDVISQLPAELAPLFPAGPGPDQAIG